MGGEGRQRKSYATTPERLSRIESLRQAFGVAHASEVMDKAIDVVYDMVVEGRFGSSPAAHCRDLIRASRASLATAISQMEEHDVALSLIERAAALGLEEGPEPVAGYGATARAE